MGKRAAIGTVAIVHPIDSRKPLGRFLFGFSCPGEADVQVACGGAYPLASIFGVYLPSRLSLVFRW